MNIFVKPVYIALVCIVVAIIAVAAIIVYNPIAVTPATSVHTTPLPTSVMIQHPTTTQSDAKTGGKLTIDTLKSTTPTAPYKIIQRGAVYTPSRPLVVPIDTNRTYSLYVNPPFDGSAGKFVVDVHRGTIFEMSGTTDLPVGAVLRVDVSIGKGGPTTMTRIQLPIDQIYGDELQQPPRITMEGTIYVEPPLRTPLSGVADALHMSHSPTALNTWRFIVDSRVLLPDEYLVSVNGVYSPVSAEGSFRVMSE